jgi:class 3 adenylate cyclase
MKPPNTICSSFVHHRAACAAVNQYKRYRELLSRELDIEPSEELIGFYKQILSKRGSPVTFQKRSSPTILVADIENASAYWIHTGRKRSEFISAYQDIFRQTARRFGGYLLQKSDDKISVLFENGQPLHYAVTIHLKLSKANWGSLDPPNVRMVVCSASGEGGGNHDFSMDTQAAANLLSTCWGGQVIFTEQTSRMVTQPPGSRIRDLGFHTLKGVREPVHILELLHPHLPSIQHQPLESRSSNLVNFPDLTPAFIGREAELEQLARLTDSPDVRIISLVGPGGVGKTRLAVQFAAQVASHFQDGVYFISLASIQDPDFIPYILADTLKFSFYGTRNRMEQLSAYLHRMNALLVFDNFEQVRMEGSKFLVALVGQTHHLKIIVTSRERLNLVSEHPVDIYGLEVPESVVIEHAAATARSVCFTKKCH